MVVLVLAVQAVLEDLMVHLEQILHQLVPVLILVLVEQEELEELEEQVIMEVLVELVELAVL